MPCLNKHKGDTWPIPGWLVVMVVDGWEVINFNSVFGGKVECKNNLKLEVWEHRQEYIHLSGQIITTSAEVTLNGGLARESPQNLLNSGLAITLICPDLCMYIYI